VNGWTTCQLVELRDVPCNEFPRPSRAFEDQADHARHDRRVLARRLRQLVCEMRSLVASRVDDQQLHAVKTTPI
jgi:hypothetical protein